MTAAIRRRLLACLHGALLGGWWGAWFFLLVHGADRNLWLINPATIPPDRAFGFEDVVLPALAAKAGFAPLGNLYAIVGLLVIAGALAGCLLSALGDWLRIDPERISRSALLDVARSTGFLLVSTGLPLALLMTMGWFSKDAFLIAGLAYAVCVLLLPFLTWSRTWLTQPRLPSRPVWAWPGWRAFGTVIVILLASVSMDVAEEFLSGMMGWVGASAIEVASTLVGLAIGVLSCAAWIDRVGFSEFWPRRRQFLVWRALGTMLALEVRWSAVVLWVCAPLLAWVACCVFVIPQVEAFLDEQGRRLPPWLVHFLFLREYWWLLMTGFVPVSLVSMARVYVSLFPERQAALSPSTA